MRSFRLLAAAQALLAVAAAAISCAGPAPENCLVETVEYASRAGSPLLMDIYKPLEPSDSCNPVILYFHGGTWVSGSRLKIRQRYRARVLDALIDSGCVVASADYRLAGRGGATIDSAIRDCMDAISYARSHGSKFLNAGGQRGTVLWGSSAGAHLAMMAAFSDTASSSGSISCIINDFGPASLPEAFGKAPGWARIWASGIFFGKGISTLQQFDSAAKSLSPAYRIRKDIPMLIFHGKGDGVVDLSQSLAMADSLGNACSLVAIEGCGHGLMALDSCGTRLYIDSLWNFASGRRSRASAK